MNNPVSILGWVLIIFTALLIISLFVSLFARLKDKDKEPGWISALQSAGKTMRDPFGDETRKMQELSEKVQQFRTESDLDQNNNNGISPTGVKE